MGLRREKRCIEGEGIEGVFEDGEESSYLCFRWSLELQTATCVFKFWSGGDLLYLGMYCLRPPISHLFTAMPLSSVNTTYLL